MNFRLKKLFKQGLIFNAVLSYSNQNNVTCNSFLMMQSFAVFPTQTRNRHLRRKPLSSPSQRNVVQHVQGGPAGLCSLREAGRARKQWLYI